MSLEGRIHEGTVVFDAPVSLPEGTRVRVEPVTEQAKDAPRQMNDRPTLLETLGNFVGALDGLPSDTAAQHDHYLYGTPKRS